MKTLTKIALLAVSGAFIWGVTPIKMKEVKPEP